MMQILLHVLTCSLTSTIFTTLGISEGQIQKTTRSTRCWNTFPIIVYIQTENHLELGLNWRSLWCVSDLYDQRIYMFAWNHYLCTMVYILAHYLDIKSVFKSLPCSTGKPVQTALNITYVCITEVFTCGDLKYPEYAMSVLYKTPNILKIPPWHPDIIFF